MSERSYPCTISNCDGTASLTLDPAHYEGEQIVGDRLIYQCPDCAHMLVDGIQGGYNPAGRLRIVEVSEDPERENWRWFGRFNGADVLDTDLPKFDAVVIQSE